MTGTVVDTLQDASTALNNATASLNALEADIAAKASASQAAATTVIQNFLARPLSQYFWVDPVNGLDANDGSSYAKAKRTLDSAFDAFGSALQSAVIFLYGSDVIQRQHGLSGNITIYGVQVSNNSSGRAPARHTISFLGTATNSPDVNGISFSAGIVIGGSFTFFTDSIDFTLPDVPSNLAIRSHITAGGAVFINLDPFTLIASGPQASALLGIQSGRMTASLGPVFGANGAGHLFYGVTAGGDPNVFWGYDTNITQA